MEYFLNQIRSKGRYAVTLDELKNNFDSSEKAILQNIFRSKNKNQPAQVRKEFYVIVSPLYASKGMVPPTLLIGDLMEFLQRQYYVGLFSAAALHGAGRQQPMQFQVMTKKPPLRSIKSKKPDLRFYVKSRWHNEDIVHKKMETGHINVSSPYLTALDLIHYNKKIGGINRIIPIPEDLMEIMKISELMRTARDQRIPDIQRLGYLLEKLGNERLSSTLHKRIENKTLRETPMSLAHRNRGGELQPKWKVILNT